jgi:hypothetical protein
MWAIHDAIWESRSFPQGNARLCRLRVAVVTVAAGHQALNPNRTLTKSTPSTIVPAMYGRTTICGICREIIR